MSRCSTTAPTADSAPCSRPPTPAEGNGANTAGGINGASAERLPAPGARSGAPNTNPSANPAPSSTAFPTGSGGAYRDNTNVDMVSRAATQQQAMEVAAQKQRTERLKSCLVERGYTEFSLIARAARAPRDLAAGQRRASRVPLQARHGPRRAQVAKEPRARAVVRPEPRRRRPSAGGRRPRMARFRARNTRETAPAFPASVPRSVPAGNPPPALRVLRT